MHSYYQIGIPCGPNSEYFTNFLIRSIEKTSSKNIKHSYVIAINKPGVRRDVILRDVVIDVKFVERHSSLALSAGHADALDLLLENIDSNFAVFVDSDVAFLKKGWDVLLFERLNDNVVMIGSEYHPSDGKTLKRPNVIACAFRADIMKKLSVKFTPSLKTVMINKDNHGFFGRNIGETVFLDTGCDMLSTLISAGYKTEVLSIASPRYQDTHSNLKFLSTTDRGEEYLLENDVVCTHIGRSISRNFFSDPIVVNWKRKVEAWLDGKV